NLYLGGKIDARSLSTLQQRNVRRILNVTPSKEAGITAGIQYKRIPVYDASTSDLRAYAEEIVSFISNGLHHGSVLVHCQRGVSRSASAVMMFLIRKTNMTLQQSLQLCQRRREMVDPIPAFIDQLKEYE
ncbi:dual specificity protein phosphatase, partial [Thalassiosira pseudonana CCMP1335]